MNFFLRHQIFEPFSTNIRPTQRDAGNFISRYGCDKRTQWHPIVYGILFGPCKCFIFCMFNFGSIRMNGIICTDGNLGRHKGRE